MIGASIAAVFSELSENRRRQQARRQIFPYHPGRGAAAEGTQEQPAGAAIFPDFEMAVSPTSIEIVPCVSHEPRSGLEIIRVFPQETVERPAQRPIMLGELKGPRRAPDAVRGQNLRNISKPELLGHPQPHLGIFRKADVFVESSDAVETKPAEHNGRRRDEIIDEELVENVTRPGLLFRADGAVDKDPGLVEEIDVGRTEPVLRTAIQQSRLPFQFFRIPEVVGIEKRDILAPGAGDGLVLRRRNPLPFLPKPSQSPPVGIQDIGRSVRGASVGHDDLLGRQSLPENAVERLPDIGGVVQTRNNHTNGAHATSVQGFLPQRTQRAQSS